MKKTLFNSQISDFIGEEGFLQYQRKQQMIYRSRIQICDYIFFSSLAISAFCVILCALTNCSMFLYAGFLHSLAVFIQTFVSRRFQASLRKYKWLKLDKDAKISFVLKNEGKRTRNHVVYQSKRFFCLPYHIDDMESYYAIVQGEQYKFAIDFSNLY